MHPGSLTSETGIHPSSVSLREPPSPARGEGSDQWALSVRGTHPDFPHPINTHRRSRPHQPAPPGTSRTLPPSRRIGGPPGLRPWRAAGAVGAGRATHVVRPGGITTRWSPARVEGDTRTGPGLPAGAACPPEATAVRPDNGHPAQGFRITNRAERHAKPKRYTPLVRASRPALRPPSDPRRTPAMGHTPNSPSPRGGGRRRSRRVGAARPRGPVSRSHQNPCQPSSP